MLKRHKFFLVILGFFYLQILASEERSIFQNISIESDQVTIDQETRQLAFKNNIFRDKLQTQNSKHGITLIFLNETKFRIFIFKFQIHIH